ncbi:MAG TPA: thioesterase family protein [Roseiflexaceae bacterium]|nr:thioesterase family protein [Roseiflexaceae bacterium]
MTRLEPGLTATVTLVVGPADTATAFASGAVEVLATPRLIGLLEEAAALAVGPALAEEQTTVGTRVDMRHLAATPIGMRVTANAELLEVEERRLRFRIQAHDEHELVAEGTHERAIVNRARFLERVAQKAGK